MKKVLAKAPGILLAVALAVPAWFLGKAVPIVGSPVLGILFGMVAAQWTRPPRFDDGIRFSSKQLLQIAIVLLGFGMDLHSLLRVGGQTLLLMLFTISAALLTAFLAGRLLKIGPKTTTLIGVGSAICGGSAIAATAPILEADADEVAQAVSTIFLFNVVAAFLFPWIGHAVSMSDATFGLWAGTAVNDTSSVVAAGYSFSDAAGDLAVIVKLTRTLMIVPIALVLAFVVSRRATAGPSAKRVDFVRVFPWFVLGFLATSVLNTTAVLPAAVGPWLVQAGRFLIVTAMAAIGLNTRLVRLVRNGGRPVLLGLICWLVLSLTSLGVQTLLS